MVLTACKHSSSRVPTVPKHSEALHIALHSLCTPATTHYTHTQREREREREATHLEFLYVELVSLHPLLQLIHPVRLLQGTNNHTHTHTVKHSLLALLLLYTHTQQAGLYGLHTGGGCWDEWERGLCKSIPRLRNVITHSLLIRTLWIDRQLTNIK